MAKKYVSLDKLGLYHEKEVARVNGLIDTAKAEVKTYAEGLGANYDKAGDAATALQDAKDYADGKDAAIAAAQKAGDDAAAAAGVADGKAVAAQADADKAQEEVDALEVYVGTFTHATAKSVVEYVDAKTAGIATDAALGELQATVTQQGKDIDAIEADYLKASDKTELQGKIDDEAERAAGVEEGLAARIKAVEDDYLKKADKEALQGSIDTVSGAVERLTNGVSAEEVDGVNDLIQYVKDHGTEVTGMKKDISDNATAIDGVAGRVGTLEGKMTTVEGAVATKAEQSALDKAIEDLERADSSLDTRLKAVEAKFGEGEGNVESQIATAKQEAIDAAAQDATTKANAAKDAAIAKANELNTAMNTRVEALEAIDHDHANKELIDTYTQTEANLADAVAKKHAHSNLAVLDGITAEKVTAWDKITGKAEQTALQDEIDRATAAEQALGARIDEFVECSQEDINNLFVTA